MMPLFYHQLRLFVIIYTPNKQNKMPHKPWNIKDRKLKQKFMVHFFYTVTELFTLVRYAFTYP